MVNNLNAAILKAIGTIVDASDEFQVSYDVRHQVDKELFKKEATKKVVIEITLSKQV